ncbi:DUF1788 domain-containing protein [Terrilactibacillus laevilacticus]|uniref:DUF1788 domain-containing protein n=1 Tax=Terrilactibacillus laevilacticus TaxID=1380157 RepID=UPI00114665D1|nr:DUF1788 domain-containing protein [Terrilactibacillus laevilacticus]
MTNIHKKLDKIMDILKDPKFHENSSLGNNVGYYIFDYDPKDEMVVRDRVSSIVQQMNGERNNLHIVLFDLYDIILDILQRKGYLEKNFTMEEKKGSTHVLKATQKTLRLTGHNDQVIQYIKDNVSQGDIVFLTGVGKAFPIIRSHTILNNMYKASDDIPVVLFFPGEYNGQELKLFGEIKDDNYYRATLLVDEKYL